MANKQIKLKHVKDSSILYHYTKSNGINGIINSNCFWATKSDFLNDPKEFSYIEKIIRDVCNELITDAPKKEMFLDDVLEENVLLSSGGNKEYFILSFSNCRDSITLWSEFGSKTGYNIGFDSKSIIARISEKNTIEYHGFVLYDPEEQRSVVKKILCGSLLKETNMPLTEIVNMGYEDKNCETYKRACKKFQKTIAVYAMFFKHSAFSEEQEYRFIFKKNDCVYYREKDGFMIPYIHIRLSDELLPLKEIVVAPKNHIDLARKGMEYMMREKGYDAKVSLSSINLRY